MKIYLKEKDIKTNFSWQKMKVLCAKISFLKTPTQIIDVYFIIEKYLLK